MLYVCVYAYVCKKTKLLLHYWFQVLCLIHVSGHIHERAFCGLPLLHHISISNSVWRRVPTFFCVSNTVAILRMVHCGIRAFRPHYFMRFKRLQQLSLTGNELTAIPDIRSLSSRIYTLHLAENNIESIDGIWTRAKYRRLLSIDLSQNRLTAINASYLTQLMWTADIKLIANQITHLYEPETSLSNAHRMHLTDNPLVCDTQLAWVVTSELVVDGVCSGCLQDVSISGLSKYRAMS